MDDNERDAIPHARPVPRRAFTVPLFWIVPLVAILIALGLVVRNIASEGPTIHIRFKNAEGIEAGKTRIKYKNVDIGDVRAINLSPDDHSVIVTAQMSRDAEKLLVDDTEFWVVKPRVAGGQVSGLGTLLSGAFIGLDIGKSNVPRRNFVGLDVPPTVATDDPGREFILHGADIGSLDLGSPVYFRRVTVGQVTGIDLDQNGGGVTLRIFVREPYTHLVTDNSRFYHASGLDVSLEPSGLHVQTQGLISILIGAIAFRVPPDQVPGPPAAADRRFTLFSNETAALRRTAAEGVPALVYFGGSVRGLAVGSAVDFRGVTVGEVRSIQVHVDPERGQARFAVGLSLYLDQLTPDIPGGSEHNGERIAFFRRALAHGLKAQLRTTNLLTGQRYVGLDFLAPKPGATIAGPATDGTQVVIPSVPGGLENLESSLTTIAQKFEHLPLDEIAHDLRDTLASLRRTLDDADLTLRDVHGQVAPELVRTLSDARRTLNAADSILSADAPVQQDLREALHQLTRTAQSLRDLSELVSRHPEALLRGVPNSPVPALPAANPAADGKP